MSDRLLTALDRLVAAVVAQGGEVRHGLLPGISEEALRDRLTPLGLEPPPDLVTLFSWHNGYDTSARPFSFFGPTVYFLPLDEACEMYELVSEFLPGRALRGEIEHGKWFPVIDRTGGPVVMDCQIGSPSFGSVFGYEFEGEIPSYRPSTLAEPIERWAGYVEQGIWRREVDENWTDYRENVTRQADIARGNLP